MGVPTPAPPEPAAATLTPGPQPKTNPYSYTLVGSYETVQVLSATQVNDVVLCTIQTHPSNVVAAFPVARTIFDKGEAGQPLSWFADGIEVVMSDSRVVAGVGAQTIDQAGLLADQVVFTVEYTDPVLAPNGVTALATVPATKLSVPFGDLTKLAPDVLASIDGVYANLKAAASGG